MILAFHGCDQSVADKVLNGQADLIQSENGYDWLGHGIYFWENSPSRALEFAEFLKSLGPKAGSLHQITKPAILGAVLNLGFCLDLIEFENLQLLKSGYELLKESHKSSKFPQNRTVGESKELLFRDLDCAVIQSLHEVGKKKKLQPFDSVRGVFWEGQELYPNAGFKEKNHIQICVRNPNCIKGFFIPKMLDKGFSKV